MDDVVFVGLPACEEHLKSRYLVFETNFDGDLDTYLADGHGDPEIVRSRLAALRGLSRPADPEAFIAYMKKCQIETTFFFADVNNRTVPQTLDALKAQSALAHFMELTRASRRLKSGMQFGEFLTKLRRIPLGCLAAAKSRGTSRRKDAA